VIRPILKAALAALLLTAPVSACSGDSPDDASGACPGGKNCPDSDGSDSTN
jgi:hypothetical protein